MLAGELYDSRDPELLTMAHRARELLAAFSAIPSVHGDRRHIVLTALLGKIGDGVWIEPPFFCDYGTHISIGANTFVNVNCVFLDSATIEIGANGLIGPGVQLLTATHPLRAEERIVPGPSPGASPYRTRAAPIRIGNNLWSDAGSVVRNIPPNTLAFGNPRAVQRGL
jgi:maltose O-acetyltransferase